MLYQPEILIDCLGVFKGEAIFASPKIVVGSKTQKKTKNPRDSLPIPSMYGIYTYICHKNQPNVGNYTIHGSYGLLSEQLRFFFVTLHTPSSLSEKMTVDA